MSATDSNPEHVAPLTSAKQLPAERRVYLRRIRKCPMKVKVAMYEGNNPFACNQFMSDVTTYGLYEAILYLENMEGSGHVTKGTTERVLATLQ